MKRLSISLCFVGLFAACTSRPTDATTTAGSTDSARAGLGKSVAVPAPAALSARLTGLGLTADHDWRRVNLGDAFAAVKATETTAPFEQDATHVGYTQEFDNLESVDYQYFQEGNKVSRIQVDLYLNSAQSVNDYLVDLVLYFTTIYGVVTTVDGIATWKNGKIELKNVSKGKDFGLKLVMK